MPRKNELFPLEVELTIAHEVEMRPILWDVQSELYKRADLKPPVWEEIAKILGPNYTGVAVANRFKNMKDTFMANLRKVREFQNKHSGSGTTDKFLPKWPLFTVLQYLQRTNPQVKSTSNIPASLSSTQSVSNLSGRSTPLEVELSGTVQNSLHTALQNIVVYPQRTDTVSSPSTSSGTPQVSDPLSSVSNSLYFDETLQKFMTIPPDSDFTFTESSLVDSEDLDDPQAPVIPPLSDC